MLVSELLKKHATLKGFAKHGVRFTGEVPKAGKDAAQGVGACPFCGGQSDHSNLYVNVENRQWDCKRCGRTGGFGRFLELVSEQNIGKAKGKPMLDLVAGRGIKAATFRRWGVGYDPEFNHYTTPVWGPHTLMDLRIYKPGSKSMSTPGATVWLVGYERLAKSPDATVYICEGEWDAEALDEILRGCNAPGMVLGVTGAGTFKADWVPDFIGRDVVLLYDHDDAGIRGEAKAFEALADTARTVRAMHWPESLPGGFDVRDLYHSVGNNPQEAWAALRKGFQSFTRASAGNAGATLQMTVPLAPLVAEDADGCNPAVGAGPGIGRDEVVRRYRQWMHLPNPEPLDVLYATLLGNRLPGDPLWLFVVAPPGGSKSELLMSLGKASHVITTTSLTPHALVSGAVSPGGGDPSLIPKLNGKVLVIKDFTTILDMNHVARDEIMGVLRDAYDGETCRYFGTGLVKRYKSTFGIVAGVTPAVEMFSTLHASLGERFLRYRIRVPGRISIGGDIIEKAIANIGQEIGMRGDLQAIGVDALNRKVDLTNLPKIGPDVRRKIVGLAQWVASTRAVVVRERYTREMMFKPVAEIGTRLGKQLGKLAMGLALWGNEKEVTEAHYRTLVRVARDTVPDRVEEILRRLWVNGGIDEFLPTSKVTELSNLNPETCRTLLQDLTSLHVVQKEEGSSFNGRWRIAPSMARVMRPLGIYAEEDRWKKGVNTK